LAVLLGEMVAIALLRWVNSLCSGVQVAHVFTGTGSFTASVTATDKGGGTGAAAQQVVPLNADGGTTPLGLPVVLFGLYGDLGQDWFGAALGGSNPDRLHDLEAGEVVTGV
jgi:hypothetical protein